MSPITITVIVIGTIFFLYAAVLSGILMRQLRTKNFISRRLCIATIVGLVICSTIICGNSIKNYIIGLQPQIQTIKVNGTELKFNDSEEIKISISAYGQLSTVTQVRINEKEYTITNNGKLRLHEQSKPVPTDPPQNDS